MDNELATPTFKLKRPQLLARYQEQVDAMYAALNPKGANSRFGSKAGSKAPSRSISLATRGASQGGSKAGNGADAQATLIVASAAS